MLAMIWRTLTSSTKSNSTTRALRIMYTFHKRLFFFFSATFFQKRLWFNNCYNNCVFTTPKQRNRQTFLFPPDATKETPFSRWRENCEFLSDLLHISREYSWRSSVFVHMKTFSYIPSKYEVNRRENHNSHAISKRAFLLSHHGSFQEKFAVIFLNLCILYFQEKKNWCSLNLLSWKSLDWHFALPLEKN